MTSHFIIPDTQVKADVPLDHLTAAGNYIVAKRPEVIIHLGDHADMPSLSMYEGIGSKKAEGQRYKDDIKWSHMGMEALLSPIWNYNKKRKKNKEKQYKPRMVFLMGNHEYRIERAISTNPRHWEGVISYDDLEYEKYGWEVFPYQTPVDIDGILYAHNFVNMSSLKKSIIGGTIENKLKHIGQSFTMGHQQQLQMGVRYLNNGTAQRGLVVGAFYQHDEEYMGSQGNYHYRGCIMKHEVSNGNYSIMELSLDYLLKNWL